MMEPGTLMFTEKTELDEEESWWLFMEVWGEEQRGTCSTCGADEGYCDNVTCIRTRITNKLFLSTKGRVPDYGATIKVGTP